MVRFFWLIAFVFVPSGAALASCGVTPDDCKDVPGRTKIEGYSDATGSGVRDEGFGRYRTDKGVTLRDTDLGRIRGPGVTLKYKGTPPLRRQKRRNCRVRSTGTIICF